MLENLTEHTKEDNNKHDDTNLDNVRIPAFKRKKSCYNNAKLVVEKLLIVSTNAILERKNQDKQDVNMKKI